MCLCIYIHIHIHTRTYILHIYIYALCMYVCVCMCICWGSLLSFLIRKTETRVSGFFPRIFHTVFAIIKALVISWDFSYVTF